MQKAMNSGRRPLEPPSPLTPEDIQNYTCCWWLSVLLLLLGAADCECWLMLLVPVSGFDCCCCLLLLVVWCRLLLSVCVVGCWWRLKLHIGCPCPRCCPLGLLVVDVANCINNQEQQWVEAMGNSNEHQESTPPAL